jgi:hypothetical protein
MKLLIATVVWGEEYVGNFLKYALPSFLASGNLPELVKHVDAEYQIFTTEEDAPRFQSFAFSTLARTLPTSLQFFSRDIPYRPTLPPREVEYQVKKPIIDVVRARQEALMFLAPDMVWANGSLGYAGEMLAAGKVATFLPNFKVTTETLVRDLSYDDAGLIDLSPSTVQKFVIKHMHPIVGSMHVRGPRAPAHHDYVIWPVGNEGIMFYYLVRGPDCYLPHLTDFTPFWSVGTSVSQELVESSPTHRAIGLSMTPIAHMMNFLHMGRPHNAMMHGQFMHRHQASMAGLLCPTVVSLVQPRDGHLWDREIDSARSYFTNVLVCRDAVISGRVSAEPPPYLPASYATQLEPGDIHVCNEVLQWTKYIIDGRFAQATLEYLRAAGDGW